MGQKSLATQITNCQHLIGWDVKEFVFIVQKVVRSKISQAQLMSSTSQVSYKNASRILTNWTFKACSGDLIFSTCK